MCAFFSVERPPLHGFLRLLLGCMFSADVPSPMLAVGVAAGGLLPGCRAAGLPGCRAAGLRSLPVV
jgi:hypothetical protein